MKNANNSNVSRSEKNSTISLRLSAFSTGNSTKHKIDTSKIIFESWFQAGNHRKPVLGRTRSENSAISVFQLKDVTIFCLLAEYRRVVISGSSTLPVTA